MGSILVYGLVFIFMPLTMATAYAGHHQADRPVSLPLLLAAEQSLSDLVAAGEWQRAVHFGEHYGDAQHNSARFYQLLAHSYNRLGLYDKALDLLRLGQELYPAYAAFSGEVALLYAARGACDSARHHWQAFSDAYGGHIAARDEGRFARLCPFHGHTTSGASLSWLHSERALINPDRHLLASEGSALGQFCQAFEGFCPQDNRFTLPPRTTPSQKIQLSFWVQSDQLRAGGHLFRLRHHQSLAAPPLGQLYTDLEASWRFPLSANLLIDTAATVSMHTIPRDGEFTSQTRQVARTEVGVERRGSILSERLSFASLVGRLNDVSFQGDELSIMQIINVNQALNLTIEAQRHQHKPAESDLLGPSSQHKYSLRLDISMRRDTPLPWQLSVTFGNSLTSYQKTLPYLTQPHQVKVRDWRLQLVMPWADFPRLFSVIAVRHIASQSSNSLQNVTGQAVQIGFQWR